MTDKIHPTHDANPWSSHHPASLPSAPPLHGSTTAVQMPERAIRKEQEAGLISEYKHVQTRQNDAHVYEAPPPAYHSYGAKGQADESYGAVAAAGRRPGHGRRRRRGGCCCCLISFAVTLGTLILIAGIAALVVYLVVRPIRKPKYAIEGIEVREFNVTNGGASVLNTQMELTVEARNPNKKIGIDYRHIDVEVLYNDEQLGEGSIPGFYQGHRDTTLVTVPIEGHGVALTTETASALQSNASMWLEVNARTRAGVKIGRWKSGHRTFHLRCTVNLSGSPHPGNLTVLSSSCKIKKPRFVFLGFHS